MLFLIGFSKIEKSHKKGLSNKETRSIIKKIKGDVFMDRKKRNIIIVSVISVIVLAVIGICLFMLSKTEKPEEAFIRYIGELNNQNYEAMYENITQQSKDKITKEDFIKRNKSIYEGMDANAIKTEITEVTKEQEGNQLLHFKMEMSTSAGEMSFSNTVTLKKEKDGKDKKYKIVWSSNLIYPGLKEESKIRVKTLEAKRGSILDRNDSPLATQGKASSIGLVPGKMSGNKEEAITKLAEILDISVDSIQNRLNASYVKEDTFVPLKTVAKTAEEIKSRALEIPGVLINSTEARVYPLGKEASHLIGYVQNINAEELKEKEGKGYNSNSKIGKAGLEKIYEDTLRGIDGTEIDMTNEKGEIEKVLAKQELKNGKDVKLTIDATIQKKLYDQVKDVKTAFVVMNPKTGELLSLISTPAYDSNDFALGMSTKQWNSLNEDANKPMLNRYAAAWSPGSTFKPVTGAIGIESGKINAQEDFGTSGLSWQKDSSWGEYYVTTLTPYSIPANLKNALIYSDNIYFAKAALKIGADTLKQGYDRLGFNEDIPFVQNITKSTYAKDNTFDSEIQIADSGYGQGKILVNPIHMASIYSAFANEGNMIKPCIEYVENIKAEYWKKNVFSKQTADTILEDLVQVVENPKGTAHSAKVEGITLGGKTGTAELKQAKGEEGEILGWYDAITADEKEAKQYVVISMVEDARQVGGSHYLFPKVQSVFE